MIRCFNCMREYEESEAKCPCCGYVQGTEPKEIYHLKPGTWLKGKYLVGTVIGFGGFGVVYKAWDDNLKRVVAIKEFYPTEYLNRDTETNEVRVYNEKDREMFQKGIADFLQEARSVAKFISHPNIVKIYDFFEEFGTAYFVMEFLEGDTLKEYIDQARQQGKVIGIESALSITKSILNALDAIHKEGILHRDMKPSNIYILPDGTVKLIDFGAARFSDEEWERTRTAVITPGYAPPEQYQEKSRQGPYTDIYAVGAMLYEMLTGVKLEESINRKVTDHLLDPDIYNTNIPKHMNHAIMRSLAVRPEIRFKNVEEFEKALISPRQVRSVAREIRYRKFLRNIRIGGILFTISVFAGMCGYLLFGRYREAVLAEASIEIWAPALNGDTAATQEMYESMVEEFLYNNPQITVNVRVIQAEEYIKELKEALVKGDGPHLFDSSALGVSDYGYLTDLDDLFSEANFEGTSYFFLPAYESFFPSGKHLPLTFDIPIVYENLLYKDLHDDTDYNAYLNNESNYLGMIRDYENVQQDMAGVYVIRETIDEGRKGSFGNLWSINALAEKEEKAACIRILYYFLSDTAQEILTIEKEQGLPLNKEVWQVYADINSDFVYLSDIIDQIPMEGEEDAGAALSEHRHNTAKWALSNRGCCRGRRVWYNICRMG